MRRDYFVLAVLYQAGTTNFLDLDGIIKAYGAEIYRNSTKDVCDSLCEQGYIEKQSCQCGGERTLKIALTKSGLEFYENYVKVTSPKETADMEGFVLSGPPDFRLLTPEDKSRMWDSLEEWFRETGRYLGCNSDVSGPFVLDKLRKFLAGRRRALA